MRFFVSLWWALVFVGGCKDEVNPAQLWLAPGEVPGTLALIDREPPFY